MNCNGKTTGQGQMASTFNICIVGQAGRLSYEAVLFAASLRAAAPEFRGRLIVGEPQPGPLWPRDPRMNTSTKSCLQDLGAEIIPFESHHFGAAYPYGNKVEVLAELPEDTPFLFFDTDTLITGPVDRLAFDFDRPSASMARENTWPIVPLYGPDLNAIWQAAYDRANVDISPTIDETQPKNHWERHLYFNAGWFFYSCPRVFSERMLGLMNSLQNAPPPELACQSLTPWLDQIALPVVIAGLGGGRPGPELDGLDGAHSLHWRALPLLYATASDEMLAFFERVCQPNRIKKVLKEYEPFKRMVYQGRGAKVRALFDLDNLPNSEKPIRNRIKRENLWMR